MLILEIAVVLALFVLNGVFAMAELAIVSSRRSHLERLVKEGRPGAQAALALAADPARMPAAVQVGFTTSATLAGIFSGATLAERLRGSATARSDLGSLWQAAFRCHRDDRRDLHRPRDRRAGPQAHRLEQSGSDCDSRRPAAHVCSECSGAADLAAQWVNQRAPAPAKCASAPGARADRG